MTVDHKVRVHRSQENLARTDQLAWKIAEVAAYPVAPPAEVADMVVNRLVDNAGVATRRWTAARSSPPGRRRCGTRRPGTVRARSCSAPGSGAVRDVLRGRARPAGSPPTDGPAPSR